MKNVIFYYGGEDLLYAGDKEPNEPGWYFWDETWSTAHGPYRTEIRAMVTLNLYAEQLNEVGL